MLQVFLIVLLFVTVLNGPHTTCFVLNLKPALYDCIHSTIHVRLLLTESRIIHLTINQVFVPPLHAELHTSGVFCLFLCGKNLILDFHTDTVGNKKTQTGGTL